MRETLTLEKRRHDETEAERRLAKALRGRGGTITRADATALTGLSVDESESALKSLLGTYKSHLAVTDKGELLYSFDEAMTRRDALPLAERLRPVGEALWKAFVFGFKALIAVTLVVYVLAFVAMLIALVFARTAGDRDDRRRGDDGFGFPWLLWWMMPDWAPPQYQRRMPKRSGPRKRFYKSVYDFVFGPPVGKTEPGAAERELVSFIRAKDGRITGADLVALTGWSYDRADEEATRLLVAYDGEPEVQESGAIVYSFPSLRVTSEAGAGETSDKMVPWKYTWDETRALAPMTGNTDGTNVVIAGFNAFNLVGASTIGPAFLVKYGLAMPWAIDLVTWFPLAFSTLFFAVPLGRWVRRRGKARRMLREALRALLVRRIVSSKGAPFDPELASREVADRLGVAPAEARKVLERLLRDLEGDVTTDDAGTLRYRFPRLADELAAVESARALAPAAEASPGQVVFSSEPDELDAPVAPKKLGA